MNKITPTEIAKTLEELGQILDGDYRLDDEGSCFLTYKESLPLLLQYVEEDGRLILASEVKNDLEEAPDSEWLRILSIDWLGMRARGCALSPDRDAGNILLWRDANTTDINGRKLQEAIEVFLDEVIAVREYLDDPTFSQGGESGELTTSSGGFIRA